MTTTTRTITKAITDACGANGYTQTDTKLIISAIMDLEQIEKQLVSDMDYLQREFDRTKRSLAAGRRGRGLGICQNTSHRIDILAARRQDAVDHVKALIYMGAQHVHGDLEDAQEAAAEVKGAWSDCYTKEA